MKEVTGSLDGSGLRIGVVASKFNDDVVELMLKGVHSRLLSFGVAEDDITLAWVAGAFEVPMATKAMALSGNVDGIVGLGCVIRGETPHFDYVAGEAASGILQVGLETGIPAIFGVLTTETRAQALERASGERGDKGADCAKAVVEIVQLLRQLA